MLKLGVMDLVINSYKKLIAFYKHFVFNLPNFLLYISCEREMTFIFFCKKEVLQNFMWIYLSFKWWVWYKLFRVQCHRASRQARKSWAPDINPEERMKDEFLHFLGVSRAIHRMLQAKKSRLRDLPSLTMSCRWCWFFVNWNMSRTNGRDPFFDRRKCTFKARKNSSFNITLCNNKIIFLHALFLI